MTAHGTQRHESATQRPWFVAPAGSGLSLWVYIHTLLLPIERASSTVCMASVYILAHWLRCQKDPFLYRPLAIVTTGIGALIRDPVRGAHGSCAFSVSACLSIKQKVHGTLFKSSSLCFTLCAVVSDWPFMVGRVSCLCLRSRVL